MRIKPFVKLENFVFDETIRLVNLSYPCLRSVIDACVLNDKRNPRHKLADIALSGMSKASFEPIDFLNFLKYQINE